MKGSSELTRDLLQREPDLAGLYISGGGITGVLNTLREAGTTGRLVSVGYELMAATRSALLDGILTLVIAHPLERLAATAVTSRVEAVTQGGHKPLPNTMLPFDIYTAENL
jgi:LacI family transcriptional regulator